MTDDPTIDVRNLREFFRDSVHAALERQRVAVEDHTEHYVVNLLTMFARSEALFDGASGRPQLQAPGADAGRSGRSAHRAKTACARCSVSATSRCSWPVSSRRVSREDWSTSTITSQWVAAPTARSPIRAATGARGRALGVVFTELAQKFQRLVDALNDVSEMAHRHDHRDVLRQYEIWLKTGSPRAHGILRSLGVEPSVVPTGRSPN